MIRRQDCWQRPRNGCLSMPDLENHWFAERLAYLGRSLSKDTVWKRKVNNTFPPLKSDPKLRSEAPFVRECRKALRNLPGLSELSRSRKELYRELVMSSALDPLVDRLVDGGGSLALELGVRFRLLEQLTWLLALNALPLFGLNYKAGSADIPDCSRCGSDLEVSAEHVFYYCERVHPFWNHIEEWTARLEPKAARAARRRLRYRQCFTSVSR